MKKILFLLICTPIVLTAQVGIGTLSPEAKLDVTAADNGLLIPRIALTSATDAATVVNPQGGALAVSTLIYNTATAGSVPNNVVPGFYYWNGTAWRPVAGVGEFQSIGGVVQNTTNTATDNFVFGSSQLDKIAGTTDDDSRMFFNKARGAFRAGAVGGANWDDANIGDHSAAFGWNTIASGQFSAAFGTGIASANFSTAFGTGTASGWYSTVFGLGNTASSYTETVLGHYATDAGGSSFDWVPTDRLFAVGNGSVDGRSDAFSILKSGLTRLPSTTNAMIDAADGKAVVTKEWAEANAGSGEFQSIGGIVQNTTNTAGDHFVFGSTQLDNIDDTDEGDNRMFFNKAKGAFRAGRANGVHWDDANVGDYSVVFGENSMATGAYSVVFGSGSVAGGSGSVAMPGHNSALGYYSLAAGMENFANSAYEVVLGAGAYNEGGNPNSWVPTDRIFSIGGDPGWVDARTNNILTIFKNSNFVVGSNILDNNHYSGHSRMFFNKVKGAFRAGHTPGSEWDDINVGENSTAFGSANIAFGNNSTALGYHNRAGSYAETVAGRYAEITEGNPTEWISTDRLFAIGNGTDVDNRRDALSILKNGLTRLPSTTNPMIDAADGKAVVTKEWVEANTGTGSGEFQSIGGIVQNTTNTAGDHLVFGSSQLDDIDGTTDDNSRMFFNKAKSAFRAGYALNKEWNDGFVGDYSVAMGRQTEASAEYSIAMGWQSRASQMGAVAIGVGNRATGQAAVAMGWGNQAVGAASFAFGYGNITGSGIETVMGRYATNAVGSLVDWVETDRLFAIGNGADADSRSNALTILKNGRLGLQSVTNPTYALELPNDATHGIGRARASQWDTYSDGRLKTNRTPLPYGLQEILQIEPLTYFHHNSEEKDGKLVIQESGAQQIGFVAQDLYKIIPEIVGKPENEAKELWGVSYDKLTPVLVKAIQEQQQMIETLQKANDELKTENEISKKEQVALQQQFSQQQDKIAAMEKTQQQWMAKMEELAAAYAANQEKGVKKAEE